MQENMVYYSLFATNYALFTHILHKYTAEITQICHFCRRRNCEIIYQSTMSIASP